MLVRWISGGRRPAGSLVQRDDLPQATHVVDGNDHLEFQRLAHPGIDDGDGPGRKRARHARTVASPKEGRHDRERSLRRGEPDPLGWLPGDGREPLQGQR